MLSEALLVLLLLQKCGLNFFLKCLIITKYFFKSKNNFSDPFKISKKKKKTEKN